MAVLYLEKSTIDNVTEADIKKIIDNSLADTKYDKLNKYYIGEHKILSNKKSDHSAPNIKIVNNMAKYITDTSVGYFIGMPVVYSSKNNEYLSKLQDIFNYNDEQDENTEIAKACSINGVCYEMLYVDEDGNIRFSLVEPKDLIMIYDTGISAPIAAIRTVKSQNLNGTVTKKVEYWNSQEVWLFQSSNNGKLQLMNVNEHYWNDIPFVEYINNEERIGDFEGVISLIDAYNKVQSNTANYFEYNDDALLKITKMGDVHSEDIRKMKEEGAIILDDGGDINWLLKTIDDTPLENYKKRLRDDMYIFSNVPNMTDEAFGGNLSGVAVSYKLWGLEQICAIKERKFKKSLQRRIELLTTMLELMTGRIYDYRDIEMLFRRNKPQNILEIAQIMQMLSNDLSRESRLKMLPMVDNVQDELDKLAEEHEGDIKSLGGYDALSLTLSQDDGGGVNEQS